MLFDSYAHFDDERFNEDRENVLSSLIKGNVTKVINCGSNMKSSIRSVELSQKYDFIYAAVGVHPHDAKSLTVDDLNELEKLAKNKKVVAIGEIGLDYHYNHSTKLEQKNAFYLQLELAKKISMPVIIHAREADGDCFSIVKSSNTKGIYHCYSGSVELMREILKLDYYISFAGPVTFKNARNLIDVVNFVPLDRFLIETDCPYLSPEPVRGDRNSSLNLSYIAKRIAEIKGISFDSVANLSMENTKKLFNID